MRLRFEIGSTVVPGDRLGPATSNSSVMLPGPGTYLRQGQLYAATTGRLASSTKTTTPKDTTMISVVRQEQEQQQQPLMSSSVLAVDQVVLCRVVRMALHRQAVVEILVVGNQQQQQQQQQQQLRYPHEGIIRCEDSGMEDDVLLPFRPGDWVAARILSLGDLRRYFLSTAEPHLGVVHAVSSAKSKKLPMVPVSWKEMQCPDTGVKESRKCAKPSKLAGSTGR